ncbi:metalloprotease (plasmid) [Cupriavidus metallidurans]|uniref:metalloprotease n=1 Tax=Cupriavidus TaxID=106589 RepID=UPI0011ED3A8A|nr:metalloprotease [Cupriavidus campinensis]
MRRHSLTVTLAKILFKDGPVKFFQLIYILGRSKLRRTYDAHTRRFLQAGHAALFAAGVIVLWLAVREPSLIDARSTAGRIFCGAIGMALTLSGATWFLMPAFQRATLLGEVTAGTLYGMLLAGVTWLGWERAAALYQANPVSLVAGVLVVAALVLAFAHPLSLFLRFRLLRLRTNHYAFETPYHQMLASRPARGQYRGVATHEAGHAVMYSLGDRVPEDALAYIDFDTISPNLGQVSLPTLKEGDISMAMLEWKLYTYLAGMVAEVLRAGTHGMGVSGDLEGWSELVGPYLLLRSDVVYFANPSNELEIESNKREVAALKKHMLAVLTRFMRANWHVVERIADCLEEVDCLDHQQLAGLITGVVRTGGLPTPVWPEHMGGTPLRQAPGA